MGKKSFKFLTLLIAMVINNFAYAQQNQNTSFIIKQNSETDSILNAAKSQIHLFIDNVPTEYLGDYGFKNKEELLKITFDRPIRIYSLIDSKIEFTSVWRVPVVVDNEYRALLTINKKNGEYVAVDYGAMLLAKEFYAKKTSQTIGLLRVYELKTDFVMEEYAPNQWKFFSIRNSKDKLIELVDIINMVKNR